MKRALFAAAILLVACKREPASGLPAANNASFKDPNVAGGGESPTPVETPPQNPHGNGASGTGGTGTAPPLDPSQMGQQMPPGHGMGGNTAPGNGMGGMGGESEKSLTKNADGSYALGPFAMALPSDWKLKPVKSTMRAADIIVSDKAGEEGEIVVYYFGKNGAGSVQDNLDRWLGQFKTADGKPVNDAAKIERVKLGGFDATLVTVAGHFAADAMPGQQAQDKADGELLACIIDSPEGPYYFKGVGAKKTMDAAAPKFRAMLEGLKVAK